MEKAIIGKKIGMTQIFLSDGRLAPVTVVPGAKEMEALAEGVLRVLGGKEPAHRYQSAKE